MVRKLSSSSGHFAYFLDILYCKVSENSSANNELVAKTFRICKNFPVSIADALTGFLQLWSSHDILINTHHRNRECKVVSEILTPTQLQASAASADEKTGFCRHTPLKGDCCTPAGKQGGFLQFITII